MVKEIKRIIAQSVVKLNMVPGQMITFKAADCVKFMRDFYTSRIPVKIARNPKPESVAAPRTLNQDVPSFKTGADTAADSDNESDLSKKKKASSGDSDNEGDAGRDAGVSDAIWESLKISKKNQAQFEKDQLEKAKQLARELLDAKTKRLEAEKKQKEDMKDAIEAEKIAKAKYYVRQQKILQDIIGT